MELQTGTLYTMRESDESIMLACSPVFVSDTAESDDNGCDKEKKSLYVDGGFNFPRFEQEMQRISVAGGA